MAGSSVPGEVEGSWVGRGRVVRLGSKAWGGLNAYSSWVSWAGRRGGVVWQRVCEGAAVFFMVIIKLRYKAGNGCWSWLLVCPCRPSARSPAARQPPKSNKTVL
ncbi:hypothetical protein E2C01_028371 [Portunus trituberculatus]|uniref:Uncharacterized protein n=1 Tax=Portunus trituberculatus TaxID=210409 RepID=A0A5B7ENZ3_PORTR|nr:hypothetical protein [Portunus trituberculatus]